MLVQAMVASKISDRVRYIFDSFMDVDRGYYPRHAFIDRRFNLRPAATAFTTITALLSDATHFEISRVSDDSYIEFSDGTSLAAVLIGTAKLVRATLAGIKDKYSCIDLVNNMDACSEKLERLNLLNSTDASELQVLLLHFNR